MGKMLLKYIEVLIKKIQRSVNKFNDKGIRCQIINIQRIILFSTSL